jgi:hypothetical protein
MYTAKPIKDVNNGKGYWKYQVIGIFDENGKQIGKYKRNYSSFYNTFFPFKSEVDGKWYALYSKDYTCTRIMSLPKCKDIGGEKPDGHGFCPTDFFVPTICCQNYDPDKDEHPYLPNHDPERWCKNGSYPKEGDEDYEEYESLREKARKELDEWYERNPHETYYAPFGFVAGCHWGDDCSWKIQYLDLSEAHKGKIKRDDRFGYIELPKGCNLKDIIDAGAIENLQRIEQDYITIGIQKKYHIDGKPLSVFDAYGIEKALEFHKAKSVELEFRTVERWGKECQDLYSIYKDENGKVIEEKKVYW